MAPVDRYESTFVVSLDPSQGDFTSLQDAINALPPTGGKIFVKAGSYPLNNTVAINTSNVQIQGEGMGITVLVAQRGMTGNTPALEVFSTASDGTPRTLLADTAKGQLTIQLLPTDAASFVAHHQQQLERWVGVYTRRHRERGYRQPRVQPCG